VYTHFPYSARVVASAYVYAPDVVERDRGHAGRTIGNDLGDHGLFLRAHRLVVDRCALEKTHERIARQRVDELERSGRF
jgi:hypothetical protein